MTAANAQKSQSQPIKIGEVRKLQSSVLGEERQLNIYLPADYSENDTTQYPVIYLLDGSLDEDFHHVTGVVQFYTFPWVNRMSPAIVVGIGTVNRLRDFSFPSRVKTDSEKYKTAGGSAKFISFIEQELQPFINKTYRTRNDRTLVGQSLGGLLATQVLLEKPSLFERYLIVSPSLWWDNGSLLQKNLPTSLSGKMVYIAVGKEGLTPSDPPRVMEVDANLLADKLKAVKGLQLRFDYLPEENHATIMHQAVMNGFRVLFESEDNITKD